MSYRTEEDSFGRVQIPADCLWGVQTQRNKENFTTGRNLLPIEVIYALIEIKKAAAKVNHRCGKLDKKKSEAIIIACDQLLTKEYDNQFPLKVYQTGSGTQTNMNVNEVLAHLCKQRGCVVHPNDHINMSQSSNDTFPTAMHIAIVKMIKENLLPEITCWIQLLVNLEKEYSQVFKIGRTHLQDATPMTFGQEISAWKTMIEKNLSFLMNTLEGAKYLTIGGTAVGTGINAPIGFDKQMVTALNENLQETFRVEENKFYGLSSHTPLVNIHGILRCLATDLLKIANDIRWLASGPRAGIGEITIPSNEPGSSIMPGKINPTQVEALCMAMCTIMGNDTTVQIANSQGNFQLNVYKPIIIDKILESIELLSDSMASFREHCLVGIQPNIAVMNDYLNDSLMLITALTPHIGYEKCAIIAKNAFENSLSLLEATTKLGYATKDQFVKWLQLEKMV